MAEYPRDGGAGALALVVALTLVLVKMCELVGRQVADDSLGEWAGAVVGAGLAVLLAWLAQRSFGRRPGVPLVRKSIPRKAWGARRR